MPNERGHYPIPDLGVELGVWQGEYQRQVLHWLRWWDREGNLLLAAEERAEQEKQRADQADLRASGEILRAEQEKQRADQADLRANEEKARAERLATKLREMGIDPDA